jgi:hypothetical protein
MTALWGLAGLLGLLGIFGLVLVRRRRRERTGNGDPLARYPVAREPATPNADAAHTPLMMPAITPQMVKASADRPSIRPVPAPKRPEEPAPPESGSITGEIAPGPPEPASPPEQRTSPYESRVDSAVTPEEKRASRGGDEAEAVRQEEAMRPREDVERADESPAERTPRIAEPVPPRGDKHFDPRAGVRLVIHKAKKFLRR